MEELIIIRHAVSKGNRNEKTSSPETTTLHSIDGRKQADDLVDPLARYLETEGLSPSFFMATDYFRTQQTMFPILRRLGVTEYRVSARFREMTYLDPKRYNGTTQDERKVATRAFWERNDPDYRDTPDSDSFNSFIDRIESGLEMLSRQPEPVGLLFSHGLVMGAIELMDRTPGASRVDLMRAFHQARVPVGNSDAIRLSRKNGPFKVTSDPRIIQMVPSKK